MQFYRSMYNGVLSKKEKCSKIHIQKYFIDCQIYLEK